MAQAAAKTGVGPTVTVAVEQYLPADQRMIDDDLAVRMLPFGMRAFVWLMRPHWAETGWFGTGEERAGHLGRRPVPQAVHRRQVDRGGGQIDAVVNLGAGFDTRVYRLPALASMPVWEVDQRENIGPSASGCKSCLARFHPTSCSSRSTSTARNWARCWQRTATQRTSGHSSSGRRSPSI